jgi:aconitate hydratase
MLGVKSVLAQSFERIHRSNLVGMGVLPLEFVDGASAQSLGLTGHEVFDLQGLSAAVASEFAGGKVLTMKATATDGSVKEFPVRVRIDTPQEIQYYVHGGILQYVLRSLLNG